MNLKSFLPLFFLFVVVKAEMIGQQFGPSFGDVLSEVSQVSNTQLDSLRVWQEQVVIHTNKEVVSPKDHLFFKAYVLTGPEQLCVSASDVLKIELLDENGTLINSQYHKIANGSAEGSMMVPKRTKSGKHYLRAYTRWMLNYGPENFATKEIAILDNRNSALSAVSSLPDIQVFAEGGNMINGLENRVVLNFKNVKNDEISVVDSKGNGVAKVKNYTYGLGTFLLTPKNEEKYFLKFGEDGEVALPEVQGEGYVMLLNNIGSENIVVKISATDNIKNQKVYLRGRVNGISLFESNVEFKDANTLEIDIPKRNLPNGLVQLQLEDEFDNVWAKRPLHVDNKQLHLEVVKRDRAEGNRLTIKVSDDKGLPVQTELSMALRKNLKNDNRSLHFETPRSQRFVNDLLVLTGRSPKEYPLNKVAELPDEIKYTFQKGLEFYGKAYDLNAIPVTNTKIQIIISSEGEALVHEVTTNDEGLFKLSGLQVDGEADMIFRRAAADQQDKYVKVIPYQYETPPLEIRNLKGNGKLNSKQFIPQNKVADFKDGKSMDRLITLEGVSLVGEKFKSSKTPSVYNIKPTRVVYQDRTKPKFFSELFMNIPGVSVSGGRDYPGLSILSGGRTSFGTAGNSTLDQPGPLWIIDGLVVGNSLFLDPEWGLTHIDIDRIEFLIRSPEASLWGSRASNGVILVYTRNGSDTTFLNPKEAQLMFQGYHDSLSFATYQEQLKGKKSKMENTILYWNPSLETDENGEAIIELPYNVQNAALQVDAKVITPDGKNGSLRKIL
ncbi:MAG: hypothetical protein AAFU74_03975 [Bacteroidota bacterium]